MYFIAIESDNEVISLDDKSDLSYNELYDLFETLYDEYKKLGSKYNLLKKNYACLLIKKDTLENKACIVIDDCIKMNQFKEENKALKEKVNKLNTT
jgi:effector-binding domain-containing protein